MAEQDVSYVSYWVAAVCGGLALVAVAWLLLSLSPGTSGGNALVRVSERQVSRPFAAHHRLPDQTQRCIDSAAARGVSGCAAAPSAPSAPPAPSDRRAQRSTHPAVEVSAPRTHVPPPPASTNPQPATLQPATLQSSTPPPSNPPPSSPQSSNPPPPTSPHPSPTRPSLPHNGPVPGGDTSPPHTGPRP